MRQGQISGEDVIRRLVPFSLAFLKRQRRGTSSQGTRASTVFVQELISHISSSALPA